MQAFRAAFFLISDWKSCQDPVLECAQNIVNTDVFDRFRFFHFSMNFEFSKLDCSDFWELFGALRSLWDDLRDSLKHSGIPGNLHIILTKSTHLTFRLRNCEKAIKNGKPGNSSLTFLRTTKLGNDVGMIF